jgi:MSHA biogenesis protein MshM
VYLEHFGLREPPFGITPDTDYFFASHQAQGALNMLLLAVRSGEGFIKVVGEVGTGKTLMCRKFMQSIAATHVVAYLPNPLLTPQALFIELAHELGIADQTRLQSTPQSVDMRAIDQRLIDLADVGRPVVVCLDEVQAMPMDTLEALRLMTNLETEKRKLLQVVIFGQPELDDKLRHPSIRQLRQRITFEYHLRALSAQELGHYLHHRMVVGGHQGAPLFSRPACQLMRRQTRGYPRLVNIVAHKALLMAFARGRRCVRWSDVWSACQDTRSLDTVRPAGVHWRWWGRALMVGGLLAGGLWIGEMP